MAMTRPVFSEREGWDFLKVVPQNGQMDNLGADIHPLPPCTNGGPVMIFGAIFFLQWVHMTLSNIFFWALFYSRGVFF